MKIEPNQLCFLVGDDVVPAQRGLIVRTVRYVPGPVVFVTDEGAHEETGTWVVEAHWLPPKRIWMNAYAARPQNLLPITGSGIDVPEDNPEEIQR